MVGQGYGAGVGASYSEPMDELRGSATERIAQLSDILAAGSPSPEWLTRQLLAALSELEELEPAADIEIEGSEDF